LSAEPDPVPMAVIGLRLDDAPVPAGVEVGVCLDCERRVWLHVLDVLDVRSGAVALCRQCAAAGVLRATCQCVWLNQVYSGLACRLKLLDHPAELLPTVSIAELVDPARRRN
jgi:hypothetical protein